MGIYWDNGKETEAAIQGLGSWGVRALGYDTKNGKGNGTEHGTWYEKWAYAGV